MQVKIPVFKLVKNRRPCGGDYESIMVSDLIYEDGNGDHYLIEYEKEESSQSAIMNQAEDVSDIGNVDIGDVSVRTVEENYGELVEWTEKLRAHGLDREEDGTAHNDDNMRPYSALHLYERREPSVEEEERVVLEDRSADSENGWYEEHVSTWREEPAPDAFEKIWPELRAKAREELVNHLQDD